MAKRVAHMDNVEATRMTFSRHNNANTAQIVAAGDHAQVSSLELDVVQDLAFRDIVSDNIVHLDQRVGISDGATVVGNEKRNAFGPGLNALDTSELIRSLLSSDLVENKATLNVIENSEVVSGLFDRDDVCWIDKKWMSDNWVIHSIKLRLQRV